MDETAVAYKVTSSGKAAVQVTAGVAKMEGTQKKHDWKGAAQLPKPQGPQMEPNVKGARTHYTNHDVAALRCDGAPLSILVHTALHSEGRQVQGVLQSVGFSSRHFVWRRTL